MSQERAKISFNRSITQSSVAIHHLQHSTCIELKSTGSAIMTSSTLEAVDPSIGLLTLDLDDFEQALKACQFVNEEERRNTIIAYKKTSQSSLDSFLQPLGQKYEIRKKSVLRLAGLFNLLRPSTSQSKASKPNDIPSTLFKILKATLIAKHDLYTDPAIIPTKLDRLSQRTTPIDGNEPSNIPEDIIQGLLAQLASYIVRDYSKILRLSEYSSSKDFLISLIRIGSPFEIRAFEPAIDKIDQICRDLENEAEKAKQKRTANEEKVQKVQVWIKDMIKGDTPDKHNDYANNRVAGIGAAFIYKVQK